MVGSYCASIRCQARHREAAQPPAAAPRTRPEKVPFVKRAVMALLPTPPMPMMISFKDAIS